MSLQVFKTNKKLIEMTEDERKTLKDKTGKQLEAQGGVTSAINSAASITTSTRSINTKYG